MSHQAIYDAVRSRISNGDIGAAVQEAIRDCGLGFAADMAREAVTRAAGEYERPSVLFRPELSLDGNQYCALYGANIMDGCAGFGDTPAAAMWDFDKNWIAQNAPTPKR